MRSSKSRGLGVAFAALGLAIALLPVQAGGNEAAAPAQVRIGLIGTMFRDTPVVLLEPMMRPFRSLMESQTGVKGQMVMTKDCEELGKKLSEEQVHFGVFHGVEFAWARQKNPRLRPLVIAINQHRHLKAYVVVHKDSTVAGLADLRGKCVALPRFSREHCHLFLDRRCQDCGGAPKEFFSEVARPQDTEAALDQVADGDIQAAIVDKLALESYERVKPGWFASLKIAQESEQFPATVISYVEGSLNDATLKRFREGLIKANQTRTGKQVLGMCRMTAFEEIPADYEQALTHILKTYPAPEPSSK